MIPSGVPGNDKPQRRLVCLAVDVSGSMDCSAANIEGVDITRLQLAAVCLQLTISALGEGTLSADNGCYVHRRLAPDAAH